MTQPSEGPAYVVLEDPDGNEHRATNPTEINTLIYSAGYRLQDQGASVDEAVASLVDQPNFIAPAAQVQAPPAIPTVEAQPKHAAVVPEPQSEPEPQPEPEPDQPTA